MSNKYKIRNQEGIYFITVTVIEWIDVFIRRHYCDVIIESLKYCQKNKDVLHDTDPPDPAGSVYINTILGVWEVTGSWPDPARACAGACRNLPD